MASEIPKGWFEDGAGVRRCSKCGWPWAQTVNGAHTPCIEPGKFVKRQPHSEDVAREAQTCKCGHDRDAHFETGTCFYTTEQAGPPRCDCSGFRPEPLSIPAIPKVRTADWTLDIHTDKDGRNWAILHEQGKMDMTKEIPADLLPFFNALKNLLAKSAEEPRP